MNQIKIHIFFILICLTVFELKAQSGVAISSSGDQDPNSSAILELIATDKGLLIPRMTEVQRDAITVGASQDGLVIFNTDNGRFEYYRHSTTTWVTIEPATLSGSGTGSEITFWSGSGASTTLTSDPGLYYLESSTFLGVGTSSPLFAIDAASGTISSGDSDTGGGLVLHDGQGSNYEMTILPGTLTEDITLTFPSSLGTDGQSLITDSNGDLIWSDPAVTGDNITINDGEDGNLTFRSSGTLTAADGLFYDNSTSYFGAGVNPPESSLHASGTITAGTSSNQGALVLHDGNGQKLTVYPADMTSDVNLTMPADAGTQGYVLTTDGNGVMSWSNQPELDESAINVSGEDGGLLFNNSGTMTTADGITYDNSSTYFGIGTGSPSYSLDVASGVISSGSNGTDGGLRLFSEQGGTDYDLFFAPNPAMTQSTTYTFPIDDGDPDEFLQTDGSGNLSWEIPTLDASNITINNGTDGGLMYNNSGTMNNADGIFYDNSTSFFGAGVNPPESSLHASGTVTAGTGSTQGALVLHDGNGQKLTVYPADMTSDVNLTMPADAGTQGYVLTTDGNGVMSWTNQPELDESAINVSGEDGGLLFNDSGTMTTADGITYDNSSTYFGIGTGSPSYSLDVASGVISSGSNGTDGGLRLFSEQGGTDYDLFFAPNPAMTQSTTYTFPIDDGDANEFLQTDGSGNLSWEIPTLDASNITISNGTDGGLMYNNSGTMNNADGIFYDNSTSFFGAGVDPPESSLHASGTVTAGTTSIQGALVLHDGNGQKLTVYPADMTSDVNLTMPSDAGTQGYVLTTDGNGVMSWSNQPELDESAINVSGEDGGLLFNDSGTMTTADGITYDNSSTYFGIGTGSPSYSLDVASGVISSGSNGTDGGLRLFSEQGGTDYDLFFAPNPAMTQSTTYTFPIDDGDANEFLQTDGSGNLSWEIPTLDASNITISNGTDGGLMYNNSGTMANADGIFYDNSTSFFGAGVDPPESSLHGSGTITAGTSSNQGALVLHDGNGQKLTVYPGEMTSDVSLVFPLDDGDANEFLQTDGSGNLSWEIPTLDASNITISNGTDGGLMYNNSGTMNNADGIFYDNSTSFFGAGIDPPESSLHASGTVTAGTTSTQGALVLHDGNGQKLTVYPADMSSDVNLTMPADAGTQGYVLTTDGNGVMSWTNQPELDESAINVSGEDGGLLFNNSGTMTTADGITYDNSSTYFGIGTGSPSYSLDVASGVISSGSNGTDGGLRLFSEQGATDYDLFFAPNPAMTQSTTYTFPIDDGDPDEFLQTDGSGNLSWEIPTLDASNITISNGTDGGLMYNNSGTMNNADGIFYDNSTSYFGAGVDPPESSLHGSGTITAGTSSNQGALVLHDGNGQKLTVYPADMSSDVNLTMPADAGTQGYVLTTDGNGVMSWTNQPELDESAINVSGEDGGLLFNDSGTMTTADGITYDNSSTYFGIGTGSPSYSLDVASGVISSGSNGTDGGLRIYSEQGGTDYDLFFAPNPAMTQSTTYTFPIDDGDANEFLQTDGSGNLSWEIPTLDASNITISNGTDGGLMYNNSGTMNNADGIFYDNSTSFFGAGIDPPESSLHASGTVTAGTTSTQGALVLHDGNGQKLTVYPADMSSDVNLTMPADVGTQGYVLTTDGNGVMSWTNQPELDESAINVSGEDGGLLFNDSGTMTTADGITYDNSSTYFGIGTGSPSYSLDVASGVISSGSDGTDGGLRLFSEQGGTDYDLFFAPNPAMTQSTTYTFPIDDGDANEFLQTDGSGNLSWEIPTLDASNITINNGTDGGLMYNNSGTMNNADGIFYDNSTSYFGAGVDPPESSLHASGTVTAGTGSTQGALVLHDGNGQKLTVYPADMTSDVNLTMPADAGTQGYVLTTDGNGVMSWTNQPELDESAINVSGEDGGLLFNDSGTMTTADGITYDNSSTYFGIGTGSPSYSLDVASGVISSGSNGTDGGLRLFSEQGGTDYDLFFAPNPAMTQSTTYTFPIDDGDANEFLQTDGSGNLSWEIPTLDASNITISNGTYGGLMYNNSGTMNNADGIFYDNSTSFFGAGIDPPESSLHASGTVTTGTTSTQGALVLHDGNGQKLTVYPADMTSDVNLTMPADAGTQGYVLTTDGNGVMSWTNQPELDESAINVSGEDGGLLFNDSGTMTTADGITYDNSSTYFGIGTGSPSYSLDVASGVINSGSNGTDGGLRLFSEQGGTDYDLFFAPNPAMTQSTTYTFPIDDGDANEFLQTDGSGNLSWEIPTLDASNITISNGTDGGLMYNNSGTMNNADGIFYDNSTSYFGAGIDPPESSLHASGTVTAGTASTQGALVLHDGNGQKLTVYPADMTSDISLTMPADAGTQGYVLTTDGNGVMSWTNQPELDESAINVSGEDGGLLFNDSGTMTTADGITYDNSSTYFGIGTGSPSYSLDVASGVISSGSNGTDGGLRLFSEQGGTDYDLYFAPNPAMTQSTTYTFPIDDGDANEFLQTDGSGNLSWEIPTLDASNITISNGTDGGLMYNNSGTMNNADGIFYDNSTSYFGAGVDPPESSLHGSGTITAGTTSTQGALVLHDGNGQKLTVYPADMTSDVNLTMPADAGTQGYVLTTDGNGVMSWTNQPELDESAINVSGEDGGLLFNDSGTMTTADGITYDNSSTYFGIGTGSPSYSLDVASGVISSGSNGTDGGLRLFSEQGGTDYDLFFAPNPAMTQSTTYTFPIDDGDPDEFLQTDGSGNLSWEIPTLDASNITISNGTDGGLMYNNSGTMNNADGIFYDNSTSYFGAGVDPPESSLHGSGTITAGTTSTQGALVLHDGNGQKLTVYPADMTSDVNLTMPADAGTQGYVLTTDGNGVMSWTNQPELDESAINVSGEDGGLLFNNSGTMTTADGITYDNSSTYFGIGTGSPSYSLDVASGVISSGSNGTDGGLRIYSEQGGTDYDLFFTPNPAMTQSTTYTFPIDDGDPDEFLQTDGSGNLSWEIPTLDASNITISNGTDGGLMYNNSGTMANADGIFYDNSTSFFGAGIDPPESSLHASGTVTAGTASTQGALVLHDGNGQKLTVYPADMTSDVSLTMPADAGTQGYVLTTDGNGVMSWTNQPELDESAINVSGEDGGLLFNNSGTMTTADGITYDNSSTYFGIGTGSPSYSLDVASGVISSGSNGTDGGLRLFSEQGATDYDLFFAPNPAMTQSTTYTFPIDDGDPDEFLQTDGSGNLSWEIPTLDASNITISNGTDGGLMYNNSGTMNNADGIFYDNSTSYFGAGVDPPESSLHGSGTITAGTSSNQGALVLHDGNGQKLTVYPADMSSDVNLTMPADAGTQGYVLTTDGNGVMSWTNQPELDESAINVSGEDGGLLFNDSGTMTTADGITYDNSSTYFGIGTGSPSYSLDVASGVISSGSNGTDGGLRIYSEQGGTDYDLFFAPNPAMTQSTTYTFPIDDGDANEFLQTDGSGNLSWEIPTLDASNITISNGTDGGLMYNNSGTMANADGIFYDNSTSFFGAGIDPPESSLHGSGTITAGTSSNQGALVLHDGNGQKLTVYPADMTSDVNLTMPADAGTQGYVLTTDGNGVMSWTNQPELDESAINVSGEDGGLLFNDSGTMTTADGITYDNSSTYFGIGTGSPSYSLDVASGVISSGSNGTDGGLRLFSEQGGTDYDLFFAPNPAMTQSTTYTFPIDDGDANEFLQTDGSGNLSWEVPTLDASNITVNTGTDGGIMYNNSGTLTSATGIVYNNSNSYLGVGVSPAESSLHGSGTITAGTSSNQGALVLHDGNGQKLTVYPGDMTSDVSLVFPLDDGDANEFLQTDGSGNLSWEVPTLDASNITVNTGTDGGIMYNNSGTLTSATGIVYNNSNSYLGVGVSPAESSLHGSGTITAGTSSNQGALVLHDGNGQKLTIYPADMASDVSFVLPADDGTLNQVLTTDGDGNLTWEDAAGGDVSGSGSANQMAYWETSSTLGGTGLYYDNSNTYLGIGTPSPSSALDVASGTITTGDNTTAGGLVISDGSSNHVVLQSSALSSNYTLTLPEDDGTNGQVLTTDGSGSLTWTSAATAGVIEYNTSSPGSYGSDQNNLTLASIGDNTIYRVQSSTPISITGIDVTGVNDGKQIILINVGSNLIQVKNENTGSDANKRILTGGFGSIFMFGNGSCTLVYDASSSRWRVISSR